MVDWLVLGFNLGENKFVLLTSCFLPIFLTVLYFMNFGFYKRVGRWITEGVYCGIVKSFISL